MSETPTPSKGQTKRRGLALPPRGHALARLQDLEQDSEEESEQSVAPTENPGEEALITARSNAVNTARSNAVIHQGSKSVANEEDLDLTSLPPANDATTLVQASVEGEPAGTVTKMASVSSGHHPAVRAAREPTTRITVDMPDSLHRKISMLSVETRRSIKDLVIEALAIAYFETEPDRQ